MNISEIEKRIESLRLKFTSGNDIPVTRAYITLEEYEALIARVRELERQVQEKDRQIEECCIPDYWAI